jgi:hypothetical protein
MTSLKTLHEEFKALKAEIFGQSSFVEVDDNDPRQARYSQLLPLFHPEFRTKGWINPLVTEGKPYREELNENKAEVLDYEMYYA